MEKYRDIDEDELLQKLSEEELQRLEDELEELDPDVSLSFQFHTEAFLSVSVSMTEPRHVTNCCVFI